MRRSRCSPDTVQQARSSPSCRTGRTPDETDPCQNGPLRQTLTDHNPHPEDHARFGDDRHQHQYSDGWDYHPRERSNEYSSRARLGPWRSTGAGHLAIVSAGRAPDLSERTESGSAGSNGGRNT
jgi:hypothetical protein